MTKPAYAAVDWGTSSFRLWLMDREHQVLAERRSGEGMTSASKIGFASVLSAHLEAVDACFWIHLRDFDSSDSGPRTAKRIGAKPRRGGLNN